VTSPRTALGRHAADAVKTSSPDGAFIDLDRPYDGSQDDLFPNPEPRAEFLEYKQQLELDGIQFVQVRPVEDIVASFSRYDGAYVYLSMPIIVLNDMEPIGFYDGVSFTWRDRRFGTYLFLCPIAKVAKVDWSGGAHRGWSWNPSTNTGSYFHIIGKIKALTNMSNRLGGAVQVPTIIVYAIDDGWRFASVSQATVSSQLAKAQQQEKAVQSSREDEKDLKAAVMMLSDLINSVEVISYERGPGFILHISAGAWHAQPDSAAFLLSLAQRIKSICSQRKLQPPSRVAVWDTSDIGGLGEWDPGAGVYSLR
jgi:hypothetical protein